MGHITLQLRIQKLVIGSFDPRLFRSYICVAIRSVGMGRRLLSRTVKGLKSRPNHARDQGTNDREHDGSKQDIVDAIHK